MMNDEGGALALRIEAAKALLPRGVWPLLASRTRLERSTLAAAKGGQA